MLRLILLLVFFTCYPANCDFNITIDLVRDYQAQDGIRFFNFELFNASGVEMFEYLKNCAPKNSNFCPLVVQKHFLYCEPPKVLKDGKCRDLISNEKWLSVLSNYSTSIFIFDHEEAKKYGKIQGIKNFDASPKKTGKFVTLVESKNGDLSLVELNLPCYEKLLELKYESKHDETMTVNLNLTQIISAICCAILLVIFVICKPMRSDGIQGTCWMIFFASSIVNYSLSIFRNDLFSEQIFLDINDIIIGITEFAIYLLMNAICFEAFLAFSSAEPQFVKESKRLIIYIVASFLGPTIFVLRIYFSYTRAELDDIIDYRISSGHSFHSRTETYMRKVGLIGICTKGGTFLFFLGSCFVVWKGNKRLRNLKVRVSRREEPKVEKFVFNLKFCNVYFF
jgi:hypothetical protein